LPGGELAEFDVLYLFVDGIAERLHLGQPREAVLAAWGILADGKKALLHLAPGTKEDTASCREFFRDMRRRGLPDPLLVVSDGAPGIIRAIEECFPRALRQRCLAHKMRNLASKVPEDLRPEFKARATACYQAASPALARLLRDDLRTTMIVICRARWPASRMISRPASRICASRSATAGRSAPPISWSGCLARSGGAPR
jgi:transposase-like protein